MLDGIDRGIGTVDDQPVHPLPHGYTNRTLGDGGRVVKTYQGPDAAARLLREHRALLALAGTLPVPTVLDAGPGSLTLSHLPGVHGQDLIDEGHATEVLQSCARLLRRLQEIPASEVGFAAAPGQVLVHGDFGPNNILLDPTTFAVTGLLDWEFTHAGDRIEDLAWCEWIIRAHHPTHRLALADFHAAYGRPVPPWPTRQATLLARCRELEDFCRRWEPDGPGVRQWQDRAADVARWVE